MKTGLFITIEGTDGAGKSTQVECLKNTLANNQIEFVLTREPGGSPLGEALRDLLLQRENINISVKAQLLMMFAARAQHLEEIIIPTLQQGKWVICDRFTDATYAYQGGAGGLGLDAVGTIEQWTQDDLRPDLTLLLDIPVETGMARTEGRGESKDRFEKQGIEFKKKIRETYLELANRFPHRIQRIDATSSIEQVSGQITNLITSKIGEWNCIPG
ncbi:MAG: dTMP kinase [Parasphingorhabdus sp.]|jgi:dTMP kinase